MPPDPQLRPWFDEQPDYGANEDLFTVILVHNGFFVGKGDTLTESSRGRGTEGPETLVHSCYSISTYLEAYGFNMVPLRGREFWEKTNGVKVHPPLYTKVMGRPKKNRRKAPEEKVKQGAKVLSKHGVLMHCSVCKKEGHNKLGHAKYMDSIQVAQQNAQQNEIDPEDATFDDPSHIQNIVRQTPEPRLDPTQQMNFMVYKLNQQNHVPPDRSYGPLPEESSFVQAARESIPQPRVRVTTATTRGRSRGRGTGKNSKEQAPSCSNGTGITRKRQVERQPGHEDGSRARTPYQIGDDVQQQQQAPSGQAIPDLNTPF